MLAGSNSSSSSHQWTQQQKASPTGNGSAGQTFLLLHLRLLLLLLLLLLPLLLLQGRRSILVDRLALLWDNVQCLAVRWSTTTSANLYYFCNFLTRTQTNAFLILVASPNFASLFTLLCLSSTMLSLSTTFSRCRGAIILPPPPPPTKRKATTTDCAHLEFHLKFSRLANQNWQHRRP